MAREEEVFAMFLFVDWSKIFNPIKRPP
ncbi:hypothetical protein DFA_01333 [Cavenderia fasciculata]|uniref:Uncharacterized protein n=1 Tax=Cavenderia fasciculata TaxID=261658 RepID=F4PS66_CACFS|nr:hypothetical protein DFA_01333 [Cavenderia fasciculata]EGG21449.1 hypothetical protein DFA_01333 [Cavenderia fasciculata]|eukprot:XP_004359299.1 hypothetical protein DFA_01333 [Cavenderia fasciculata]